MSTRHLTDFILECFADIFVHLTNLFIRQFGGFFSTLQYDADGAVLQYRSLHGLHGLRGLERAVCVYWNQSQIPAY